ncbi:xanthine dehydrogenase [Vibrio sp. 10N.286.49.C2]|uniref:xanthine dehydrogenase family protein molybdopterin-binding subunit n=1 Tax=unclassified Vibrio TaxID=2614977 RepID=UPI000C8158AD|nr:MULTISPECIES: molybdopterin cofactor-binding domain-containing protein [unclassified Vibrio]PMH38339.1 xanthine dehydrogenase [Vibrio sp. 10N.286.49.C2]PMH55747.1 xanthine dehydrogenase [Vibrio sp. 10N.286.49.B1]PMH78171.1 xanthine dehydrogenase [Vibrio sp. 10N.286.48.B7]
MSKCVNPSRRTFIKQCVIGGVTVYSAPMLFNTSEAAQISINESIKSHWKLDGEPQYRTDAIEKVTGQKIYGRDYRARDISGWPDQQHYGYILRANKANHIFEGFDLSGLPDDAQPYRVVTQKDLEQNELRLPAYYGKNMLLKEGSAPDYLGHELGILLFDSFSKFKKAKIRLQFNDSVVSYGAEVPLTTANQDPYATWRIVREENADGRHAQDAFSVLQDGMIFTGVKDHKPDWPNGDKDSENNTARAVYYADRITDDLSKNENDWLIIDKEFNTQSIEPMMFEAEAFNGYLNHETQTLHVVITTQSPQDFHEMSAKILSESPLTQQIKNLVVHSPFIGGGFGAKDHTIFPYYGVIASLFAKGPLRIANDRFEQFQSGLKRHPFVITNKLAFNKKTHKIEALKSHMLVDGGGRLNFSSSVTMVGASALQGIYYIPRNDIEAVCYPSQTPHCGSMRGYGTLQSMPTIELMLNEAAEELKIDPFTIRRANAMQSGDKNTQGAIPNGAARYHEMLDMAEQHPVWVDRIAKKKAFEQDNPNLLYGVGFSIVTKDYGTGAASPSGSVEITPEGKVIVQSCFVEMGTGTDTAQGVITKKYLGVLADNVVGGVIEEFEAMELFDTQDPYLMSQDHQDEMQKDPRWTPVVPMASSASMSAFYQSHVTEQASRILFEQSLYPAAIAIWREQFYNGSLTEPDFDNILDARWVDGKLTLQGYPGIPFKTLAMKAHANGSITSVMVHGFNRWAWANSAFDLNGKRSTYPIDGLAVKYGINAKPYAKNKFGYQVIERRAIDYPKVQLNNAMVTYYAPAATLAEIAIDKATGHVNILETHTWLEAGRVIVPELVEGQIEGGLTMGVGHTLYEYLPADETGAGNGTWNLNRYQVPLAAHIPVWNMKHTILPPLSETDNPKGIAEVVMVPVVAALVEAIYQATNTRFYHLPVTPQDIMKVV